MDKIVKFIDLDVPITSCNLKCHYCYVMKNGVRNTEKILFKYSPEHIGKALTKERLGGICHFNMCGHGETLLPKEVIDISRRILENGHYLMIVTNGLLTKRIKEMIEFPEELRERLGFKFSFHYLELVRTNQLKKFFDNIRLVRRSGCSFSVEMTPSDELIPHISTIKEIMMSELGALCHVTVPRDGNAGTIPLMSKYSIDEYTEIWKDFDSELFRFKASIWNVKRCEFCYAGAWSGLLNLGDGEMYSCYGSRIHTNAFEQLEKPIKFTAVGRHCNQPHCYNGHSFLTFGLIPEMGVSVPTYAQMREREDREGCWLNEKMRESMSQKLYKNNPLYGKKEEYMVNCRYFISSISGFLHKFPDKINYEISRRKKQK